MRGTSIRTRGLLLFGLAALGALSAASAFVPQEGQSLYEVPLRHFYFSEYRTPETVRASSEAAALVEQTYGGNWRVHKWNPQTRTPSYLIGSGVDVAGQIVSRFDAESVARQVIADNPQVFKADLANLRFDSAPRGMGKVAVHFQQTYHGLDVWQGKVRLTFTEGGRLFVMGSQYYPGIDVDPNPSLSRDQVEQIAATDIGFDSRTDKIQEGSTLLVLPVPVSETEVDYHLVWRVRVETEDPLGIWVTHVDAHSGEIVWRYNDIHFLDFQGDATSNPQPATYCNGQEEQSMPHVDVTVDGVGTTTTDEFGNWTVPYAGSDDRTVTATMFGPYIRVQNQSGSNAEFSATATPGVPLPIVFDDSNAQRDERDCFDAINDIHDFFQSFDPTFSYINQRIYCNVSINSNCNAYWNGTINFYTEGGGCANTGEIQGVVHHEFGHGIQNAILGSQGNEGLGEGNSDIIANLMTQESIIGRGFYLNNCTSGIRNSDNNLQYPEDMTGQIHHDGQIIAGFHWDFMELLQDTYGVETGTIMAAERWHFGRILEHPYFQDDQVIATFIADDDDGNLDNGTPNYWLLAEAADNHGYEYPIVGVRFDHSPPWSTEDEGDVEIVTTVWSTIAPIVPASITLHYQVNGGGFEAMSMNPTGNPDEYAATIQSLTQPSIVEYYLSAEDEQNNTGTSPTRAPDELHSFNVALVADQMEVDTGWIVNLEGLDTATTGQWVREEPVGTDAQPDEDHTSAPGEICWVTGNAPQGSGVGTNDVDDGFTSVYSAEYDLTDATEASVSYWRWYSNNRGASPNADLWKVAVRNNGGGWTNLENNQIDQNIWVRRDFDLYALYGNDLGIVQFKFVAEDANDGSIVEAAVDDFDILALLGFSSAGEQITGNLRFALHGSLSNPVVGATQFRFQVPVASNVELSLFDVSGRTVSTLADGTFSAGVHNVPWDGRDAGGQPVAAGVYYARMQAGEFSVTRPVVVSR